MSNENPFDDAKKFKDELHERIHREIHDSVSCGDSEQEGRRKPLVIGVHLGSQSASHGGMVTGAILVLIGLAFLLDRLGYISIHYLWRFWPMLIVLAGIINASSRQRRVWGVFLIAGGGLLQLNLLGITHFGWGDFWPMVLIALGLVVMWGSFQWRNKRPVLASGDSDPRTTLQEAVVFGGLERRMTSQDFQGGHINAVFGGVELDLSEANIQADEATLEINAVFGGVELRVPPAWQVAYRGTPLFGGIEDKTRTPVLRQNAPEGAKPKTLILTGAVVFGGLEIKN